MRPPRVRTRSFPPSIRRIYTSGPCSCWASSCLADLPAFVCLMRFLFVGSVVCRRLPSAHASRRWPCHWLCAWRYLLHSGLAPIRTRPCRAHKQNPRDRKISGVLKGLARQCPTFTGNTTNYHRPKSVSLSCSEWEGVVPLRYGRRAKGFDSKLTLLVEFFAKRSKALRAAFAVFMSFILIKPSR